MNLLYYNPVGSIGGAEMCLLDLLGSTIRARPAWRLSVVLGDDGPLRPAVERLGARCLVEPLPERLAELGDSGGGGSGLLGRMAASLPSALSSLARLRRLFRSERPDLIQTNGMKSHLLGSWAAPRRVPVVWHLHDYPSPRPAMARLLRASARRPVRVVAVSRSVADDARRALGSKVPIRAIHNAVDLRRFAPGPPKDPAGPVRVGLVATFARWKGHDVFFDAISRIAPDRPARFSVIGGPIYRSVGSQWSLGELKAEATRRGVADRVSFEGPTVDPASALRSLDVAVHASTRPEPFGRAIVEGMATGLAVVVMKAGGAAELFEDGESALGCPPGDPAALARAIDRLILDPALRRRLGENGRKTAQAWFDADRLFENWFPVYADALEPGQGRPGGLIISPATVRRSSDTEVLKPRMAADRKRKWIVTGGAGFIGCHAASRFHRSGHHVVVVDNLSRRGAEANLDWLRSQGVEDFVKLDIRDAKGVHDLISAHADADAVLHLAGQVAVTTSVVDPRSDFDINALGTLNVLEAVRLGAGGGPAVLYSSTNKVYGHLDHIKVVERDNRYAYEDRPFGVAESDPLDFFSPYGCSKGAGDQYVRDYARIYGMKTVSFRQSCLAADQEVVTPFGMKPISLLRDGEIIHSGRGWTKVRRVWKTGVKPVRRLTTMGGLSVTLTEDHRVVRPHGLFSNRDFAYGDFLAVMPEARHIPKWEPIPDRVLTPDAYLESVRAKTSDKRCLNEAVKIADRLLPLKGDALLAIAEIAGRLFGDGHLGVHARQSREAPAYTVQHFGSEAELAELGRWLEWLGLPASSIIRWEAVSTLPNGHTVRGISCRIQQQSIPIFTLFEQIGVPAGDKVRVDYEMPAWVREGHPLLKRAFLRGFLGAELCKVQPDSYIAPSFAQSKDVEYLDNGRLWLRQLRDLLGEFGIETSCFEATPVDYKRGTTVQTTVRLLGGRDLYPKLAAIGYGMNAERSERLNALLRWQWTNTTPDHFERSHQLYHADGEMQWDSLATVEPLGDRPVYDLEVEDDTHLFVAGGIQVSNCIYGTRQFGIEDQGWVAWFCLAATRGQAFTIFGDGKQIRDTLWIDDLIDAYETALDRIDAVKGQVFNIGGGPSNTLSLLELVAMLERHFGRALNPPFADWRPGDQPVFVADIRKASRLLDWSPKVATAEGVGRLLAWIDDNRGLFTV